MIKQINILVAAIVAVSSSTAVVAGCYASFTKNCAAVVFKVYGDQPSIKCELVDKMVYDTVLSALLGSSGKDSWYVEEENEFCIYACHDGTSYGPTISAAYPQGASCSGTATW
jgi:hypothetical protein